MQLTDDRADAREKGRSVAGSTHLHAEGALVLGHLPVGVHRDAVQQLPRAPEHTTSLHNDSLYALLVVHCVLAHCRPVTRQRLSPCWYQARQCRHDMLHLQGAFAARGCYTCRKCPTPTFTLDWSSISEDKCHCPVSKGIGSTAIADSSTQ